jgi:cytoskeleton protein RodZ
MVEAEEAPSELIPQRVGDRLRAARIAAKLDLADVAARTRVPLRHLKAIEGGDYAALPALTYCIGFVKAYARAVGEDEVDLGRMLRSELGAEPAATHADYYDAEAADPARMPTRNLAWTALALAVLLIGGYLVWRNFAFAPDAPTAESPEAVSSDAAPADTAIVPAVAPNPKGQVVLTATDAVWISVKDSSNKPLIFRELKAGESFAVPADADHPRILTGRPEKLKVLINGKEVAPLGPPERTVKDLEISASALAARPATATAVSSAATNATSTLPQP